MPDPRYAAMHAWLHMPYGRQAKLDGTCPSPGFAMLKASSAQVSERGNEHACQLQMSQFESKQHIYSTYSITRRLPAA